MQAHTQYVACSRAQTQCDPYSSTTIQSLGFSCCWKPILCPDISTRLFLEMFLRCQKISLRCNNRENKGSFRESGVPGTCLRLQLLIRIIMCLHGFEFLTNSVFLLITVPEKFLWKHANNFWLSNLDSYLKYSTERSFGELEDALISLL